MIESHEIGDIEYKIQKIRLDVPEERKKLVSTVEDLKAKVKDVEDLKSRVVDLETKIGELELNNFSKHVENVVSQEDMNALINQIQENLDALTATTPRYTNLLSDVEQLKADLADIKAKRDERMKAKQDADNTNEKINVIVPKLVLKRK